MSNINNVLSQFVKGEKVSPYGGGHINDTYISESGNYIIQKINTNVFGDYQCLMDNILNITEFLKKKIILEGGDPDRETLTVVKTISGENFFETEYGEVFRVYKYIKNSKTVNKIQHEKDLYYSARAFGKFQRMLSDFPSEKLNETIKNFHNTPARFLDFENAVQKDEYGRSNEVKSEIEFILCQKDYISVICDGIADGSIPKRVTHNDTKIDNVLFDKDTNEAICVIDLDTVMPGSLLYDFGDALRMGATNVKEDDTDLTNVSFNKEAFRYFTRGFLEELYDIITKREIELLPFSVRLLTLECGIRFLTDYLCGDKYFKTSYQKQNLNRTRVHLRLVQEIMLCENILKKIVFEEVKKIDNK